MRIDHTHKRWLVASLLILGIATAVYVPYARRELQGPHGGTPIGLAYGVAGLALMIFAGLLGARKKVPVWRVGRAQTWMRGHLWLGPLILPLILFHGGFHFGGTLTTVLMVLLILVLLSGIVGAVLQHFLPHVMTREVPLETIFEEIENVREQLLQEADEIVTTVCGPLGMPAAGSEEARGAAISVKAGGATAESQPAQAPTAVLAITPEETAPLRTFYLGEVRPYLRNPSLRHPAFGDRGKASAAFESMRKLLPRPARATLKDLESICEEERQLARQVRLQAWLQDWLLLHIPLSLALLLLSAAHAVLALRY